MKHELQFWIPSFRAISLFNLTESISLLVLSSVFADDIVLTDFVIVLPGSDRVTGNHAQYTIIGRYEIFEIIYMQALYLGRYLKDIPIPTPMEPDH